MVFLEPTLSDLDYLNLMSANRSQITLGALLEISNAFAYLGIALLMFPIFRKRCESVALPNLGYLMLLNEVFLGLRLIVKGFNQLAEIKAQS